MAIGQLTGGRRLLSDDLATLEAIAVVVARRIDAIRITNERYEREIREQEIGKLATEAELRALRAQINPHFLFNALTTIGYLIQTAPPRALETLLRLTALLRAVLRSEGEFTTLGRELEIVESYLDIERARFEQRLRVTIDVPARLAEHSPAATGPSAAGGKRRQAWHRTQADWWRRHDSGTDRSARRRPPTALAHGGRHGRRDHGRSPSTGGEARALVYETSSVAWSASTVRQLRSRSERYPAKGPSLKSECRSTRESPTAMTSIRWRCECTTASRRRRRRTPGSLVSGVAAAVVRRRGGRRRSGVRKRSRRDDRKGKARSRACSIGRCLNSTALASYGC